MNPTNVYCLASSTAQADQIIRSLHTDSVDKERISVLFPDLRDAREFLHDRHSKAPEGAVTGAGTGGVLGGVLGWTVGIGAVSIPGAGPFIAAGPLLATLSVAAIGAAVGGITGALIGLGIPEIQARQYESRIHAGQILISVEATKPGEIARIRSTFVRHHALDISQATPIPQDNKTLAGH